MLGALLLSLAFSLPTDARTVPQTEIVAPEMAVTPGKNVRLSIKPIEKSAGLKSVGYAWVIAPDVSDDSEEWPDHTRISFGSGITAGSFQVTVVSSFVFENPDKSIEQIQTKTKITVQVANPPPLPKPPTPDPVNPTPTPTPDPVNPVKPVLPDGKYKLAQYMYTLCKLTPPDQAHALADSFASVAKQCREGAFQTKGQAIFAMASSNSAALGTNLTTWKPVLDTFATWFNSTMKAIIITPADCGVAYDEIATGLYAVGK